MTTIRTQTATTGQQESTMTTQIPETITMTTSSSVIKQLQTATQNPSALLIGGACGALVPLGTNYITHDLLGGDLLQFSVLPVLVLGGLVFSSASVYAFSRSVFGSWYKALGFVTALEGYMTATTGWLSLTALTFLVAINAIANGCQLAQERQAELDAVAKADKATRAQRRSAARATKAPGLRIVSK